MMGKIKLNLVSGAVVEKPLINAFRASNNSYVVLDNEINGSMGLPIILVCKFEGNKLIKIVDANEWSMVKEYLKNIIAGNQVEFIKINEELSADDIYYTQLTLPVPSFDALKNAYKVKETEIAEDSSADIMDMLNNDTSVSPVKNPEPSIVQTPIMPEPVNNQVETPVMNMESPVIDMPVNPVLNEPVIEPTSVVEQPNVSPIDIVPPITPNVDVIPQPVIEPNVAQSIDMPVEPPVNNEVSIFAEQKEAFMQACENMFDALVQKFEKELENRK